MEKILVIESDLPISPDEPGFDADALSSLVKAGRAFLAHNPSYDSVRVVPVSMAKADAP
jgi:hypothetical protein